MSKEKELAKAIAIAFNEINEAIDELGSQIMAIKLVLIGGGLVNENDLESITNRVRKDIDIMKRKR